MVIILFVVWGLKTGIFSCSKFCCGPVEIFSLRLCNVQKRGNGWKKRWGYQYVIWASNLNFATLQVLIYFGLFHVIMSGLYLSYICCLMVKPNGVVRRFTMQFYNNAQKRGKGWNIYIFFLSTLLCKILWYSIEGQIMKKHGGYHFTICFLFWFKYWELLIRIKRFLIFRGEIHGRYLSCLYWYF